MATYGNTSASSLLRQAAATANKQREYEDAIASYNFFKSDAQGGDFETYANYLRNRIKSIQATDPSKALSLQRTLDESYRRFNSAEISRATLAVNYGAINNREKYARMLGLYQNAVANGDDALAARLESNLASLSITIQNEDSAAAGGGGGGGRGGSGGDSTSTKDFDNALKHYDQQLAKGQLSPADYFSKSAQVYQLKEQTLLAEANAGSSKAAGDLESLRANDTFQKVTSPDVQAKLQRGEVPLAIKRDDAGNLKYDFIKEKDQKAVLGPDGKPMRYADLKDENGNQLYPDDNRVLTKGTPIIGYTNNQGTEIQRVRKFSTDPKSSDAIFQYKTLPKDNPTDLNKIFDFTSGRQMVVSNPGEGQTKDGKPADFAYVLGANGQPIPGTDPYGLAGAGGDPTKLSKDAYDKGFGPVFGFNPDNIKETYGAAADAVTKDPVGLLKKGINAGANILTRTAGSVFGGRALNDLISMAQGKQIQVAKAKAEAARQAAAAEAIRQAQARNAALAATIRAQAAKPVSVVSRSYIPTAQYARTPVQNYAAGSQGKTTPAAVAHGIGEVVGYNQALKGVGLF
jgi:hypothetical protein